jgi:hypothetical protein
MRSKFVGLAISMMVFDPLFSSRLPDMVSVPGELPGASPPETITLL